MAVATNLEGILKSGFHEGMKSYYAYDASDRLEYIYESPLHTADGEPCLVTQLTYVGVTSRVQKKKESQGAWVAGTMDI